MSAVPCYRAAHLRPYLAFLHDMGAPVEHGLRQAGLPTMVRDEAGIYLPQLPSIDFVREMTRREGIDEMPLRALGHLRFTDLSEQFRAKACSAPTLKVALESFCGLAAIEDPYLYVWISYGETTVKLCMAYRFPLDSHGLRIEDWNNLIVAITIVRAFAGPSWQPEEMAFRSRLQLARHASEQFPNTHLLTGAQAAWIAVPRDLLSLPPRNVPDVGRSDASLAAARSVPVDLRGNLSSSLKAVLTAYLPESLPTIDLAAEIAATSVRTLQRRLKEHALTYSDLIAELRYEKAARLLRQTDATALEIALEVGYEDPSHFSRAFKRIAGLSPREYRRQHSLH